MPRYSQDRMIKLSSPATRGFWEIPVLYEDEHLMALDKPAGLLTAPREDPAEPSLIELLHQGIRQGKPWAKARALSYLLHVQPLDPEASGVFLLAKTKTVLTQFADLFGNEQPILRFVTLVHGSPAETRFSVEAKLAPHPVRSDLMTVSSNRGKRARSQFEVLERFESWALVRSSPLTWRQHQIRVHLAQAGLPLAGDELYRGKPLLLSALKPGYHLKPNHTERPLVGQPILHAEQLESAHPVTGERLTIQAPWPKQLAVAVKYLRRYGIDKPQPDTYPLGE